MDVELIIAILGIIVALIIGAWQIYLSHKQNRILVQTVHVKDQKLVDSFAFGYSLIGAVAAADNPALSSQRDTCLHGLKQASEKLDIKTSSIVKHAISIEKFLSDNNDIPLLRDEKFVKNMGTKLRKRLKWLYGLLSAHYQMTKVDKRLYLTQKNLLRQSGLIRYKLVNFL